MPELKLIIFDVDGTLADTEHFGHLPASNEAMESLGLDIHWDWEQFRDMIHTIPGSAKRLRHELSKRNFSSEETKKLIASFEPLKKDIYIQKYLPQLQLRKGVRKLIDEAIAGKIKLAIISTSYEIQIRSLLRSKLSDVYHHFEVILGKESGIKTNNGGFLHKKCLQIMNCSPHEVLMIEDSEEGLEAALCANIPTAVFYNDYTFGSSFKNARLVAPSLEHFNLQILRKICIKG